MEAIANIFAFPLNGFMDFFLACNYTSTFALLNPNLIFKLEDNS